MLELVLFVKSSCQSNNSNSTSTSKQQAAIAFAAKQ